jgi:hypothetical protein
LKNKLQILILSSRIAGDGGQRPCYSTAPSILIGHGLLATPPSNMACTTTTLEEVRFALFFLFLTRFYPDGPREGE